MSLNAPLCSLTDAVDAIRNGRPVVVVDPVERQHEGDVTIAAEHVTPQVIAFMATHARGLISLTLTPERCDKLRLRRQVENSGDAYQRDFMVSIEARTGVSTGISAADRARTISVAADVDLDADAIVSPGHIFPLRARPGGLLDRPGHTEAAVELATLAGLSPAGVICQVMNADGTMARLPQLSAFCARHGLLLLRVEQLVEHRLNAAVAA